MLTEAVIENSDLPVGVFLFKGVGAASHQRPRRVACGAQHLIGAQSGVSTRGRTTNGASFMKNLIDAAPTRPHDPQWFDRCFLDADGSLPADIRAFAEAVCRTFDIRGICDPMYIANVAAFELLRGNGSSDFTPIGVLDYDEFNTALTKLCGRLVCAYATSVGAREQNLRELACLHLKRTRPAS